MKLLDKIEELFNKLDELRQSESGFNEDPMKLLREMKEIKEMLPGDVDDLERIINEGSVPSRHIAIHIQNSVLYTIEELSPVLAKAVLLKEMSNGI